MKPGVLFLDFDGVLHPKGAGGAAAHFSRRPLLEKLLLTAECLGVSVVVSSTWREAHSLARLRSFFCAELQGRIIGHTPVLEDTDVEHLRYREIRAWLNQHPEIRRWCALDDDRDGFPESQLGNVVFTDPAHGIADADLEALRALIAR
jgi:hypothetical protein